MLGLLLLLVLGMLRVQLMFLIPDMSFLPVCRQILATIEML